MAYNRRDDDLAYGDYNPGRDSQEGQDRGMIGDMGRRLFGGRKEVSPCLPTPCGHCTPWPTLVSFKGARGRSRQS
jgi:hypothetical protein